MTRQCRKLNDHPLRAPFVSSASFDYYTPKYQCPPPLKTAIKSSDLRCTHRGAVRLTFAILFRRQKLSRDRNYNFFWDRPAQKQDCSRILIISLITFYLVMIGARGKGDDSKNNHCNDRPYIIYIGTRSRIESWLIDRVYTARNGKKLISRIWNVVFFSSID